MHEIYFFIGTKTTLMESRPLDKTRKRLKNWEVTSVHYWGESPGGMWIIEVNPKVRIQQFLKFINTK